MTNVIEIDFFELLTGFGLLAIPCIILWYYKTNLVKDALMSSSRMIVQLLLVGLYLEYIFKLNNGAINIYWVLMMATIASATIIQRSGLKLKPFFIPILFSIIISVAITDTYFLGFVIKLNNIDDARYFVPITGMLIGNTITNVIISLDIYFKRINENQNQYKWYLGNGASQREALLPFVQVAIKSSINPMIANLATTGLITLPGMMTGQILGGINPNIAVKYQIMLLITSFASAILNIAIAILFSNKIAFDNYNNLKKEIFKTA